VERERDEARADWARLSRGELSKTGCSCGKHATLGDGAGMRDGHGDRVTHTRPGYGVTCETVVYRLRANAAESALAALREEFKKALDGQPFDPEPTP